MEVPHNVYRLHHPHFLKKYAQVETGGVQSNNFLTYARLVWPHGIFPNCVR